ncbi:hypothetical protein GCM10028778_01870 [Barrientosiimonas marina]
MGVHKTEVDAAGGTPRALVGLTYVSSLVFPFAYVRFVPLLVRLLFKLKDV